MNTKVSVDWTGKLKCQPGSNNQWMQAKITLFCRKLEIKNHKEIEKKTEKKKIGTTSNHLIGPKCFQSGSNSIGLKCC